MNNKTIAEKIQHYAQLLELQGANTFKVRAYKNAYPILRNYRGALDQTDPQELVKIDGIGDNIANKVEEIISTGTFSELEQAKKEVPAGLIEMMNISGLGPAKVRMLWQDLGISSLEELISAAEAGKLDQVKGFGSKTIEKITQNAHFLIDARGKILLSAAEELAHSIEEVVGPENLQWQADWYRKEPVVSEMKVFLDKDGLEKLKKAKFEIQKDQLFAFGNDFPIYISDSKQDQKPPSNPLEINEIRGLVHMHTVYSDGNNTLAEMAAAARDRGLDYMLVTDHSKSAGYANGLQPDRITAQHKEIDQYNQDNPDFFIFKGIESDILSDGNLDYSASILSSFDAVIASVHSGLDMDTKKATERLIASIENPATKILGHPTARLLLKRPGYSPDMEAVIDAAVAHGVAIEINSNPRRLDIDYSWLPYGQEKGLFISINPDAHFISGIDDIRFGVWMANKVQYPKELIINTYSLEKFNNWLKTKSV